MLHLFNAATFEDLKKSPGALSVICSSQCTSLCCLLEVHNASSYYPSLWDVATGRLHAQPIAAIMLTNCARVCSTANSFYISVGMQPRTTMAPSGCLLYGLIRDLVVI